MQESDIRRVSISDAEYPKLLKEIHDPPETLYVCGTLPWIKDSDLWSIAIVGTRKPTEYGKTIARQFADDLAAAGAVIVSGAAIGIDSEAHRGALKARGKTVAVIGSGMDRDSFYPKSSWSLAEAIIKEGGAVISEYAPGTPALPHHFLARNRIIVGLSQGIILVEAQERSGTQATARFALEENRDLFAVPGSIFSLTSRGPNRLIKEGATPLLASEDIFEFYGKKKYSNESEETFNGLEAVIIEALREPASFDDLVRIAKTEVGTVQATLSLLLLHEKVIEIEPGMYQQSFV